jgi:predicted P-loop ATPase
MLDITTFQQKNYAHGQKTTLDFAAFSRLFAPETLTWLEGEPTKEAIEEAKDKSPLWCPSVFEGDKRSAKTVVGSSALVFDLDREGEADGVRLEGVLGCLEGVDCWCVHSTAKGALLSPGRTKLRVILPLARAVDAQMYRRLWHSVRDELGLPADESKVGPESCFFLPSVFSAHRDRYVYVCRDGAPLEVGGLAMLDLNGAGIGSQIERHIARIKNVRVNKANALVESGTGLGAIWVRSGQSTFGKEDSWLAVEQALRSNKVMVSGVDDWLEARGHFERGWDYGVKIQQEENATVVANDNGRVANTDCNLILILENAACVGMDRRKQVAVYTAECPWSNSATIGQPVPETDGLRLVKWLKTTYGMNVTLSRAKELLFNVAEDKPVDCLHDYIMAREWPDGLESARKFLSSLLVELLQADDTPINRAISLRWHIGLVARQMRPGVKFDNAIVLVGKQGVGKSSYLRELFPEELQLCCFSDCISVDGRDAALAYSRFAVIEYGELAHMSRKSIESIKQELSAREATIRPAYARSARTVLRTAAIAGTTNEDEFLVDVENRRFWPVAVRTLDLGRLRQLRGMIWAAGRALFEAGEPWWLSDAESSWLLGVHAEHESRDPWVDILERWLSLPVSAKLWSDDSLEAGQVVDGKWAAVRMADLGAAVGLPSAMGMADSKRLGRAMRKLGWEQFRAWVPGSERSRTQMWRRAKGGQKGEAA